LLVFLHCVFLWIKKKGSPAGEPFLILPSCLLVYRYAALPPRLIAGRKIIIGVKVAGAYADNHL
jgi:hypothetical protein